MLEATSASVSSWRSSARPPGSPMRPVPPPATTIGRFPASCRRRRVTSWTRLPTCRLRAVGSKPMYAVTPPASSRARIDSSVTWWMSPRKRRSSVSVGTAPVLTEPSRAPRRVGWATVKELNTARSWSHWTKVAHVPVTSRTPITTRTSPPILSNNDVCRRTNLETTAILSAATAARRNGTPSPTQYTVSSSAPRHAVAPGVDEAEKRIPASAGPVHGDQPMPKSTPKMPAPPDRRARQPVHPHLAVEQVGGRQPPGEEEAEQDRDAPEDELQRSLVRPKRATEAAEDRPDRDEHEGEPDHEGDRAGERSARAMGTCRGDDADARRAPEERDVAGDERQHAGGEERDEACGEGEQDREERGAVLDRGGDRRGQHGGCRRVGPPGIDHRRTTAAAAATAASPSSRCSVTLRSRSGTDATTTVTPSVASPDSRPDTSPSRSFTSRTSQP